MTNNNNVFDNPLVIRAGLRTLRTEFISIVDEAYFLIGDYEKILEKDITLPQRINCEKELLSKLRDTVFKIETKIGYGT